MVHLVGQMFHLLLRYAFIVSSVKENSNLSNSTIVLLLFLLLLMLSKICCIYLCHLRRVVCNSFAFLLSYFSHFFA